MSTAAAAVNPVSAMADKYSGMDFVNLLSSLAKQVSGELFRHKIDSSSCTPSIKGICIRRIRWGRDKQKNSLKQS